MWGAIIGDIAGSIYEGEQVKNTHRIIVNNLIEDDSFFSDDTILTIAILDAYLNDKNYEEKLKEYVNKYRDIKHPYFNSPFSPGFIKWADGKRGNNSIGNGAMMRISSIPYLANSFIELIDEVNNATSVSHNTREAVGCTLVISDIIYSSIHGMPKEELQKKYKKYINYHDFEHFNSTCYETLNNCLYALFSTNCFEDAIKEVISYGGDTDTNACIVGSMAESMYGVPNYLIEEARSKLPSEFIELLDIAYSKTNNKKRHRYCKHD